MPYPAIPNTAAGSTSVHRLDLEPACRPPAAPSMPRCAGAPAAPTTTVSAPPAGGPIWQHATRVQTPTCELSPYH
eukprot:scaffold7558_cov109-Isochrysis_galbana.AAC.7